LRVSFAAGSAIRIPFNRPYLSGREFEYVADAVRSGQTSGDGPYTRRCQSLLEHLLGSSRVLLTTSCTSALEMCALLLNIRPGDEVIVPSFTFVSTINAFVLRGARPVFVDIRPDTLNLDEEKLEAALSPRTRAIVPVHYAGVGCEMDTILQIAARNDVAVVEDAAQGLFAHYRDRPLGTIGRLGALSFHETKNVSCGEGGALLINDPQYIERSEVIREKGTDRARFFRGQVDKYTWVDLGSSHVPSDILAAFLLAQLEAREEIQAKRQRIWRRYAAELAKWAANVGATLPAVPPHCLQPFHMFYVVMPSLAARQALITHLRTVGVLSVFHYVPLHLSPMGRQYGGRVGDHPFTESVADRLVRLPFYTDLSESDQQFVIEEICQFRPGTLAARS
jgi:dTDP-4-amino-4,6-dideoxygalactose transaminase